jgi:hypothetical protein
MGEPYCRRRATWRYRERISGVAGVYDMDVMVCGVIRTNAAENRYDIHVMVWTAMSY